MHSFSRNTLYISSGWMVFNALVQKLMFCGPNSRILMIVFWKADIFSITAVRKLNIADTNWFVIINVHAFKIRILFTSTNNFKLFLITDKLVSETNRAVGREEAVTDADRASEGDVECTGHQAAVPLRGSDESMYIL